MNKTLCILLIIFNLLPSIKLCNATGYGEFISCDALNPEPHIILLTSYGQLVHDLSTSQQQIQNHASRQPEKGFLIDGLATVNPQYKIRISQARGIMLDENNYCILPDAITVYIGYQQPTIYVAKEYPKESCRFSVIIRHEQTHQRINILTLQYFLPLFEQSLSKAIREVKSVKVSSKEEAILALKLLQKYYVAKLTPIVEEFEKARIAEQLKLDNKTNYSMEDSLCRQFDLTHSGEPEE